MKIMKNKTYIFLVISVFLNIISTNAQEKPISEIKAAARYTTNGVELRFFPDRKKRWI
jgi:preprotein translocase subunit SecG